MLKSVLALYQIRIEFVGYQQKMIKRRGKSLLTCSYLNKMYIFRSRKNPNQKNHTFSPSKRYTPLMTQVQKKIGIVLPEIWCKVNASCTFCSIDINLREIVIYSFFGMLLGFVWPVRKKIVFLQFPFVNIFFYFLDILHMSTREEIEGNMSK